VERGKVQIDSDWEFYASFFFDLSRIVNEPIQLKITQLRAADLQWLFEGPSGINAAFEWMAFLSIVVSPLHRER
jgi:hypothetical protein